MVTTVFYTWLRHRAPASLVPAVALHTSFDVIVGLLFLRPDGTFAVRPLLFVVDHAWSASDLGSTLRVVHIHDFEARLF